MSNSGDSNPNVQFVRIVKDNFFDTNFIIVKNLCSYSQEPIDRVVNIKHIIDVENTIAESGVAENARIYTVDGGCIRTQDYYDDIINYLKAKS